LGRLGDAVVILRGSKSPIAKAGLAEFLSRDTPYLRLLGVRTFDPALAAKLARESVPILQRDAKTDAESALVLGHLCADGVGVEPDPVAAYSLYRSAADRGHVRAIKFVARCYFAGTGVPKDPQIGRDLLKQAADRGDVNSMVILGERYERGNDGSANPTLASQLFEKAANAGNVHGMRACARVARNRELRALKSKDLRSALKYGQIADNWLREAAGMGDSKSMLDLANFTRDSMAAATPKELFSLYREAADSGVSFTLLPLAACYLEGSGTPADYERALDLIRRAEAAAKREGNEVVEGVAHKLLTEKTKQGQISLIRHELGWLPSDAR
jgi:TPR repeat protein